TGLPLAAEIFQAEVTHLLATRIHIVLLRHQRARARNAHIMASVAQSGAAQEVHPFRIVAGDVKPVLGSDGKQEWSYLVYGRKEAETHIREAIALEAAVRIHAGDVMAEI